VFTRNHDARPTLYIRPDFNQSNNIGFVGQYFFVCVILL
jgi:hypothetical protein